MHRKSGLFQLRKIITCSKGYITLLFPSIPTAHLIHSQEYSAMENKNSKKMFRFILLKKFSELTVVGCQQEYMPPGHTKQLLTSWVVCLFCPSYKSFLALLLVCLTISDPSSPMNYTLVSQYSKATLPCPDHNSLVWTLIFLFSCQVLMDENTEVLWSESAAEGTEEKTKQFLTLLQCDIIQKLQNNVCPVTLMCPAVLKLCSAVGSSDRL